MSIFGNDDLISKIMNGLQQPTWKSEPVPTNDQPISRIVERLAECADVAYSHDKLGGVYTAQFDRAQAEKILAESLHKARETAEFWMERNAEKVLELQAAQSELSRVRGLLQRQWMPIDSAPQTLVKFLASMDYTLPDDAKEVADQLRAIAWRPINSAPRTGEHILVTRLDGGIGFGTCGGKNQAWSAVVHWWDADGEQGWYLSSGNDDNPTQPTHWMALAESPLSSPPPKRHCGDRHLAMNEQTGYCSNCRETERVSSESPAPQKLQKLRAEGWMVAVHNDYRLNGELFTFWLLTKGDRFIKGEGRTDEEALLAAQPSGDSTQPAKEKE